MAITRVEQLEQATSDTFKPVTSTGKARYLHQQILHFIAGAGESSKNQAFYLHL